MKLQHSKEAIEAMQSVKKALDPNGILNPGKIFHPLKFGTIKLWIKRCLGIIDVFETSNA